jgi:hypothetical protein
MQSLISSLESHLYLIIDIPDSKKGCERCKVTGSAKFHRQAVRDYSKDIKNLSECL